MAENLPINFAVPAETSISSYSYTDLATGRGYITFYGFVVTNDTTEDYLLSSSVINSDKNEVAVATGTPTDYTNIKEMDFDSSVFSKPITISGDVYITSPFGMLTGTGNPTIRLEFYLYKVSGGVETQLGTVKTKEHSSINDAETSSVDATTSFNVSETILNAGDFLRLTVIMWAKIANGTGTQATMAIGTSPNGYTTTYVGTGTGTKSSTTKLLLNIPTKIEI